MGLTTWIFAGDRPRPGHFLHQLTLRRTLLPAAVLLAVTGCTSASALSVTIPQVVVQQCGMVTANVHAVGDLGIESGLGATSSQAAGNGNTTVSLGIATEPGFYPLRISAGDDSFNGSVVILPGADQDTFEVMLLDFSGKATAPAGDQSGLLKRFWGAADRARIEAATQAVWKDWLAENSVGIGGTVVICMIPGEQVACGLGTGGKVLNLGIAIVKQMVKSMVDDGTLTADEGSTIDGVLGLTNVAASTALGDGTADRLNTLAGAGVEATTETPDGKIAAKFAEDALGQFIFLIKLAPK